MALPTAPPPVPPFAGRAGAAPYSREYVPRGGPGAPPPQVPFGQQPPRQPDKGFPLPWWAMLAAVPMALIQVVAAFMRPAATDSSDRAIVLAIGSLVMSTLFAGGGALVLWLLAGRSRKAAGIALIAVYGLFTLPDLARLARGPRTAQANNSPTYTYITESGGDGPSGGAAPMVIGGPTGSGSSGTGAGGPARVVEQGGIHIVAKPGAGRPTPKPVAPVEPVAPRILSPQEATRKATDAVRAAQAKTTPATQRWAQLGAFDLANIKDEAGLVERMEAADALAAAMREARDGADAVRDQLKKDLQAARVPTALRTNQVAMWVAELGLEDDRQVALATERFMAVGRGQLQLLQREWGRWSIDPQTNRVVLRDKKAAQQFSRGAQDVEAARKQLVRAVNNAKNSMLARGVVR